MVSSSCALIAAAVVAVAPAVAAASQRPSDQALHVVIDRQPASSPVKDYVLPVVAIIATLSGIAMGNALAGRSATAARAATRREDALENLDAVLADAEHAATGLFESGHPLQAIDEALSHIERAYAREAPRVGDAELFERLRTVSALLIASRPIAPPQGVVDPGLVLGFRRAVASARASLAAALAGRTLPSSGFPSGAELRALLTPGAAGPPFERLQQWLIRTPPPPEVASLLT